MSINKIFKKYNYCLLFCLVACDAQKKEMVDTVSKEEEEVVEEEVKKEIVRVPFYFSMFDNSLSQKVIDIKKIDASLQEIKSDKESLYKNYSFLNMSAFSKSDYTEILNTLNKVSLEEMSKDINFKLSDSVKLDLIIYSIRNNKYHMALSYLEELEKSENKKSQAVAYNIRGILAYKQNKKPEAVEFWKKSLENDNSLNSAHLNLGFILLSAGFVEESEKHFSRLDEDWLALSAIVIIKNLQGDNKFSSDNCNYLLSQKIQHKPTLINCSIVEVEQKNFVQAKKWLSEALKIKSDDAYWDDKIYKLLESN